MSEMLLSERAAGAWIAEVALCIGLLGLPGCSGGGDAGSGPPPPPVPSITSIAPAGTYAGTGGFGLTVNGSGFTASSSVRWNGSSRVTTFVSSTQLIAQIPSSDFTTQGMFSITVVNPTSGASNALTFTVAPGPAPGTGVTQLIDVATDGTPANGDSFTPPAISADGRYVAFQSDATNLVSGPASGFSDIYVQDTCLGAPLGCTPTTIRASLATDGTLANGNSRTPSISSDGRYVAFDSSASNLVPNDTNGQIGQMTGLADIFVRDTCIGAALGCTPSTVRVSLAFDGSEANGDSRNAPISANGRFLAFNSTASNLVPGDTNGFIDVFIRDTCVGAPTGCAPTTLRASLASDGSQADSNSFFQSISSDGRFVAFHSFAANLVSGDTNGQPDVFVRDTCIGVPTGCTPTTTRVTVATDGTQANDRDDLAPSITADGRFLAFTSFASNLVAGDTNGFADVFVRDTCTNAPTACTASTARASVAFEGSQANEGSGDPSISADGRLVVFESLGGNLIPAGGSPAGTKDVFLWDTCFGAPSGCIPTTILLSMMPGGNLGGQRGNGVSDFQHISADGHFVVFRSTSTNLLPGVSDGRLHIYLARTGY